MIRRLLLVLLVAVVAPCCCGAARAAVVRPNALDRRVDKLSSSALLTLPATRLVDPDRQVAAERLVNWKLPGWLFGVACEAFALAYFWRSGGAATLRDRLRRRLRSEAAVRFLFGAALGVLARLAALPAEFYLYRVERVMGLSIMLARTWGEYWLGHTLLAAIVAGTIAAVVLWLVDRTHQWYLYTVGAIVVASVAWAYAAPYVAMPSRGAPLHGPLAVSLDALLDRAGFRGTPVLVGGGSSPLAGVVLQGTGSVRRVLIPAPLLAGNTQAETIYHVASALSADLGKDPFWIALIEAGIVALGSALAVVVADRIGFRRDDDALSRLALVGALMAIVYVGAVPVRDFAVRRYQMGDDAAAVALTGDRAAAVRAIVRVADQEMREVCPSIAASAFLDLNAGTGTRVAAINGVPSACP
ncbi:MAG TPA: hypothetical protein VMH02_06120 [Verrucomicrobiae bacterium]|nr:hypothetical protein [Verrucomicrobiae bacterium]